MNWQDVVRAWEAFEVPRDWQQSSESVYNFGRTLDVFGKLAGVFK